jgi:double zinc ribbon protein/zinc ribbon protein
MKCPNCGAENQDGLRFCEQCASALAGAAPPPKKPPPQICPSCGVENPPGLRFCEQCATSLEKKPSAVAAETVSTAPPQVCPNCGAENATGLRFCEQCASLLVVEEPPVEKVFPVAEVPPLPTGPAAPPPEQPLPPPPTTTPPPAWPPKPPAARSRRRWAFIVAGGALVAIVVAGVMLRPLLLGGGDTLTLPNVGDLANIDRDEAATLGVGVIDELFPQFEGIEPVVFESNVDGHRIMDVSFTTNIAAEKGGYRSIVIVSIDTADESITILESN